MDILILIAKIVGVFTAIFWLCLLFIVLLDKYIYRFSKLYLYAFYTNNIVTLQLIQYDTEHATLYDYKEERMILMSRSDFVRDFKLVMHEVQKEIQKGE